MPRRRRRSAALTVVVFVVAALAMWRVGQEYATRSHVLGIADPIAPETSAPAQNTKPEPWEAKVVGVTDGDTLTVLRDGNQQVKVRLHGIDAPEKAQAWGERSKQSLSELVFGQPVTVREVDRDRYGRTVAEVYVGTGLSANEEQLRRGLAWWYVDYAKHETRFEELQAEARAAKRGLWGGRDPVAPWEFRKAKRAK